MQTLFDRSESQEQKTMLEQYAEQEQKPKDGFLAARVVLLIAAGVSAFTLPWPVTFFVAVTWVLVMVWPHK